jgi:hypothetical protein
VAGFRQIGCYFRNIASGDIERDLLRGCRRFAEIEIFRLAELYQV